MTRFGGVSGEYLRQYIERIERLEEEKTALQSDIRDVYAESKANGFDPKIMRQIVKLRKLQKHELEEHEELLDIYKQALGMLPIEEEIVKNTPQQPLLPLEQAIMDRQ